MSDLNINVKLVHESASLPVRFFKEDFCCDVTAVSEEEVAPNVWRYGLGLAFQIDRENLGHLDDDTLMCIDFRSRSSIWKTGMTLANSVGTIDELYNGEVTAVFYHVMPNMPRYKVGDRIGQIKVGISVAPNFIQVHSLKDTDRGSGGYGSTGK